MSEPFKIGTYQLGWRWVDVYAEPGHTGGWFYFMPDGGQSHTRIRVGFDYSDIDDSFCILVHEAMEALIDDAGCRMRPTSNFCRNASDLYRFAFDHNQMTDIAAKLGCFLWSIRKDFEAAFELVQETRK